MTISISRCPGCHPSNHINPRPLLSGVDMLHKSHEISGNEQLLFLHQERIIYMQEQKLVLFKIGIKRNMGFYITFNNSSVVSWRFWINCRLEAEVTERPHADFCVSETGLGISLSSAHEKVTCFRHDKADKLLPSGVWHSTTPTN